MVNALIPRANSVNQYFEIDIILYSKKGIYVLELKDWSGFIYVDLSSDKWDVGIKDEKHLRIVNSYYNQYMQNLKHIEDFNNIHPHQYKSYVIFSIRGETGQGFANISYYEGFVNRIKSERDVIDLYELEETYNELMKHVSPDRFGQHIERIKYNESKYSRD